jgi:hypothetical protein
MAAMTGWGYVFLAGAAILLLANEVFNGTRSHIRFITAQLTIERLVLLFSIDWERWRGNKGTLDDAFGLLTRFGTELHAVMRAETDEWGAAMEAALQSVAARAKAGDRQVN